MKKRLFLGMLILTVVFAGTAVVFAETDSQFSAFTSSEDASLDGWTGYTKNNDSTVDSDSWYSFAATKRLPGNVMANMPESWQETGSPHPNSSIFYTAKNFGSEYNFTGDFYNYQNQDYIYFNSSVNQNNGTVSAKSGYRIMANRSGQSIELQKYSNSSWVTLASESTAKWGWVKCHFDITFTDGVISANVTHSNIFDVTLNYDVSQDSDYYNSGYIGFGATSGKMLAGNINVSYNSEKIYRKPVLKGTDDILKGYSILPQGRANEFKVYIDMANEGDVKNICLYVDNAYNTEMAQSGDAFSANVTLNAVGTHTVKIILTDRYGNEDTVVSSKFFVSDFLSCPAVFTDSEGNEINSISDFDGNGKVSFKVNPCDREFSSLTLYAVKYDENGRLEEIFTKTEASPAKNTETEITADISGVMSGQTVSAFLFASRLKPSPVSGVFTLE